ncbi:YidC/Oxa1 family membrane protein insertase, partial [Paragonimus westermani]
SISIMQALYKHSRSTMLLIRLLPPTKMKTCTRYLSVFGNQHSLCNMTSPVTQSKLFLSATTSQDILAALPEPPLPPVQEQLLNALGEPSLSSLGLCSYWPSGWYQAVLESLHVSLELPWWAAIATTTVLIRLCLFPLIINQRRSLARYSEVMPKLTILQDRMTNARLSGDHLEMVRLSKEMQQLMTDKNVNPLRSMKLMFVQIPIFLSVFAGIRGMAALPVPSMQTGGLAWFTDLTVADPYCLLPLLSMSSILLMFEAILWYWTVSNFISLIQASVLRITVVRNWLKLPIVAKPPEPLKNKRGFIEGFRETMTNSRLLAELDARERLDAKSFRQAGRGAIPRTFAYNPKAPPPLRSTGTIVESQDAVPTKKGVFGRG